MTALTAMSPTRTPRPPQASAEPSPRQAAADYARIERAIAYLQAHYTEQPDLAALSAAAGLSRFHFQRVFTRWAGISPHRFLQVLALAHAKRLLAHAASVLDAAFDAGLSGPGRLHDLFVTHEAVTPGEFKCAGEGLLIRYGLHETPLGRLLLAETGRGICGCAFVGVDGDAAAVARLAAHWPNATLREDARGTARTAQRLFTSGAGSVETPLHLHLRGTNFQVRVWQALLAVPAGAVTSYGALAGAIGQPGAARAVGRAVAANPVAVLIPCHRVIRGTGELGGYQWGTLRKQALLLREAAATLEQGAGA